jgi:hypothetical protein
MFRRLVVGLLLLALAGATMGQDSCSTETGSDEPSTSETSSADREAARERKRERRAEKRRAKKRRAREKREREARLTPTPAPQPEPDPPESAPSDDCHPSYEGACLDPSASDYDCAGGSGDGPEYADGPIQVVGDDPYDLDRDGDGTACET